jgi:hypothetical protein
MHAEFVAERLRLQPSCRGGLLNLQSVFVRAGGEMDRTIWTLKAREARKCISGKQ